MFDGCTSLTNAPLLPATTLTEYCYNYMFKGCTSLSYIKCLATDISATNCTANWVNSVSATGTFVKDPNMTGWTTGVNGIPSGWTVKNPSGIELSQELNVATIEVTELDSGTGYYTINGGSQVSLVEGVTTVAITEAMNGQTLLAHGEFDGIVMEKTLVLSWVDYTPTITISESQNYVTITAPNANIIQYRLGSSGEYANYTAPVYIATDTTIYVTATRTVSGVDYTSTASQAVTHELIPPTNLTITCTSNTVTISATNATTLEYNLDGGSNYTTYTEPFAITETVTVYAKATNSDGSITASQECEYSAMILLNWLESNGNPATGVGQIILTNINPYKITTEIKVAGVTITHPATGKLTGCCGCWNTNNNRYYVMNKRTTSSNTAYSPGYYFANRSNTYTTYMTTNDINNPHVYIYNQGSGCDCYCDGVRKGSVTELTTSSLSYKITLFGQATSEYSGWVPSSWRIYYAKFTDKQTGQLVGDFIPVLDSNGTPCMYDRVTQQYFYNQGSGTFTYEVAE